jgi:hypothetical protein
MVTRGIYITEDTKASPPTPLQMEREQSTEHIQHYAAFKDFFNAIFLMPVGTCFSYKQKTAGKIFFLPLDLSNGIKINFKGFSQN